MATMRLTTQALAALDELSRQWGATYDIAVTRAGWVAKRLNNGRPLAARDPDGLRELITADSAAEPASRNRPDDTRRAS
jgi:hypothetical protein